MVFSFIKRMSNAQKEKIRRRLAIIYAVIAWNGFAICLYSYVKRDKRESGLPLGLHEAARTPNTQTAKVIRFDGLSFAENREYDKEQIEEARHDLYNKAKFENSDDNF